MQVYTWQITVSNIYLNQTWATIHVGHYPRLVIIIIMSPRRSRERHIVFRPFLCFYYYYSFFLPMNFVQVSSRNCLGGFYSNLAHSWTSTWSWSSNNFFKFRASEISSIPKKRPNFQLSPIGLKFGILGIWGVLNMMVIMKFFCDRNFDRPKNGRIFNFVRFAWNLVSRVYEVSWTRWWCSNFSANEISTVTKKRPNFQLWPIGLKFVILGIWGVLITMVMIEIFLETRISIVRKSAEFSTLSDWLEIW